MSLPEIPISLTPQQAAAGAVVTVPLPTGATRVRIPPARDGDLVRATVGDQEVLLRVRVTAVGAGPSRGLQWLGVLGVVAVIVFAVVLADGAGDDDGNSPASAAGSSTYEPYTDDPYSDDSYTEDPYSQDPYADATDDPATGDPYADDTEDPYATGDPYATESEAPDPYESGTCLNGTLPDSTTAQEVSGVEEVSCSASDAHYQVIETIPFTSDMSRCEADSRTQYAFSYRYTINGAAVNEYVYCLVGLGSYAR
ncbi:LppU/SCO3897 family protein [Streptomyces sp. NBC_01235]|uniref:LppU/SCO3897 family protein n=1 Tax=Streptomyces sp. NBC_01235 TaxID=2903788 RepID=UPI002E1176C6|nr:hypothetical protein OG289_29755 [Streptomyces sp. NBC_01235]